jgi:mannose-6-phosphate isomerase-like protein (cupin superfamily)
MDFKGGWFIGDFEPSVLRTKEFEVNVRTHKKGEKWDAHYHKEATEYNVLVSGKMDICGSIIGSNTVFVIEPEEIAAPVFLEDCVVVCIKTPSNTGDKYIV